MLWRHEETGRDEATVRCEMKPGQEAAWSSLSTLLAKELAEAHENLRFHVEQAAKGELPRFELKAKRVKDDRIVIGTQGERRTQG